MKILRIGGKNLASLAGEFSVDFEQEPLASSGLFAISGPTGAGKSTLLDALCLALYDDTPRLLKASGKTPDVGDPISSQDSRTLLRRGTPEGYAEVDFVGGDGAPYRARWSVRRSRTRVEGALQPTAMTLHLLPGLQPIGATKTEVKTEIEKRIGLSFEQFTRAVLLAQNEFATFLKAGDDERGTLLETLTGSNVYSDISIRAHERAKLEKLALEKLFDRLADQKPMGSEERANTETQRNAADQALVVLDERKTGLETQLRWHQQTDKLREGEQQALAAWQQRVNEVEAAAPRHQALAQLDAVQAARPLDEDIKRIGAETAATQAAIEACGREAEQARLAQQKAAQAMQQAGLQLTQAEQAQRAAAPQLDQAKALDARIEAMLPAYRQAKHAYDTAQTALNQATQAQRGKLEQQRRLAEAQQAGQLWLQQHQQWRVLAQDWPRWDVLLVQSGQVNAQAERLGQAQAAVLQNGKRHREEESEAKSKLQAATTRLEALEAQRQQALSAIAQIDADMLHRHREQLERRRDALAGAEKVWLELSGKQARKLELNTLDARLQQSRDAAEQLLAQAQQEHAAVMAAFAQAERSLKLAEAACGENVEKLRATLEDETPCPVCGAHEHPYRHSDGALQAMLAGLQGEVHGCRDKLQHNIAAQAVQRNTIQSSLEQLAANAAEQHTLDKVLDRGFEAWQAATAKLAQCELEAGLRESLSQAAKQAPGQDGAPVLLALALDEVADPARADWFAQQLEALQAAQRHIAQQEQILHRAAATREQAQRACDQATAEHTQLQSRLAQVQTVLAELLAEHKALDMQRMEIATQLSGMLDELDAAFSDSEMPNEGWKDEWKAAPARFHEKRQAESRQWQNQHGALEERAAAMATLEVELEALSTAQHKAAADAEAVQENFRSAETALLAAQDQRATLWNARRVEDVERDLQAAIDKAKASQAAQQEAAQQAAQTAVRSDEALVQAQRRLATLHDAAHLAALRLEQWLQDFRKAQAASRDGGTAVDDDTQRELLGFDAEAVDENPEGEASDTVRSVEQLRALLAHPAEQILAERQHLQALEQAAASAHAVLQERQAQTARHLADAGQHGEQTAEALQQALEALAAERKQAHDQATALRIGLAQDDARRHSAQAMMGDIEKQEESERRWARMSELIGSADGKKFRNYAQQFTLDVLLGYANAHLNHLAPRYQLERINNPSQPSLGLLVRDQHMGDELRSVHSLSGGESFLASLALALGLASLSSNRVKVESLFIDEGFGSLDADTLRVAMDALDGLQAMGRKVGVISHVQEMTDRIASRIVVQPAADGRSVVTVQ
ncbi:AAA family ATPase [Pseudoduganella violacea]|uniref:Exonuclease SbcC n=1 Tax=Pseudoduganella violacea TaxID=1715466 RepID=A0A7W5FW98_9BURK|nr:AAA family ATPase [Pseudoduganella violacea]MBB3121642.1 exonuclease SbcC [Pseudoduganella violacea]